VYEVEYTLQKMNRDNAHNKYILNGIRLGNIQDFKTHNYNTDNESEPCLSYDDFLNVTPMYAFDIANQPETLTGGVADAAACENQWKAAK